MHNDRWWRDLAQLSYNLVGDPREPTPRPDPRRVASVDDAIAAAARSARLLEITYDGVTRLVEPYSFRVSKRGHALLYAWCTLPGRKAGKRMTNVGANEDQHGWESFLVAKIRNPRVTDYRFNPRTRIEI